jgi:hypothetical protein
MNIYQEARAIAQEAINHCEGDFDAAREYVFHDCDMHEVAIYYHKAIQFCADQDTSKGEQYLEDLGGIAQPGDSFGNIACRIAFATLLCEAEEALDELLADLEDAA